MAGWRSSIGFFGVFGRSSDLRQLDDALRSVDLHPRLVPEAVKLTAVKLLKEAHGAEPPEQAYREAAELLCYCAYGAEAFAGANGDGLAGAVERRIEAAAVQGEGLDGALILLTLHAGLIQPSVVRAFDLESVSA